MVLELFSKFILLFLLARSSLSDSGDLYNTKTATSDLHWTLYPAQNGWEELSNKDLDGKIIRSYQVCKHGQKSTNNWVRTTYIQSNGAKRAYIDIEFSMRKCEDLNSDCRETFNLYYFEVDNDVASSTFPPWRENPYVKIDTIAAGERFDSSDVDRTEGINHKTWTLGPLTKNGFYIAAQDRGACMAILSLRVYYFYCPDAVVELGRFQSTVAGNGTASLEEVKGLCVVNASPVTTDGPRFHCNSNGEWKVRTGDCHCDPGYQRNNLRTACRSCASGYYKSDYGNHECAKCPVHSDSNEQAFDMESSSKVNFCPCSPGYFRAPNENIHSPCSKPPSIPLEVTYVANATSLKLSWKPPLSNGGRNDLYYNVDCQVCNDDVTSGLSNCAPCPDDVIYDPVNHRHLMGTNCTITNLKPYTNYQVKIYAMNGVTSSSNWTAAHKTITVKTNESVPSPVDSLSVMTFDVNNFTLSWKKPIHSNGEIVKYEVAWNVMPGSHDGGERDSKTLSKIETNATKMFVPNLTPGQVYSFRVRASTRAGFGQFGRSIDAKATSSDIPKNSRASVSTGLVIGVVVGSILFAVVLLLCYVFFGKQFWPFRKNISATASPEEKIALHSSGELVVQLPRPRANGHRIYVDYPDPFLAVEEFSCELNPEELQIKESIGQGEFGEVCRAVWIGQSGITEVAVKRMKEGSADQSNFLREASTMAQFSHPNVIKLKGVVTKSRPFMIVTEFMKNGSLDSYLKVNKNKLQMSQLFQILQGISSGMRYLSNMKYVHRDLAARNILLDSNLVCKVSDFGLSRTLQDKPHATYTTQGGKIAIRWTAPECIRSREFTSSSDVWSYGIVMWEVMSYGEKPYWEMTNEKVIKSINEGFRLPAPDGCPVSLHRLMVECWAFEATMRPTMDDVHRRLGEMILRPKSLTNFPKQKHSSNPSPC